MCLGRKVEKARSDNNQMYIYGYFINNLVAFKFQRQSYSIVDV
jgi:hypothetical protein